MNRFIRETACALCVVAFALTVIASLAMAAEEPQSKYPSFGSIERKDPAFDKLLPQNARLEKLASGFEWAEGPVWSKQEIPGADLADAVQKNAARGRTPFLLFSDIPPNRIMRWSAPSNEAIVFMQPAGYTGSRPRGGEPGTNGLTLDKAGRLVACDHGDRRVYRLESDGTKKTLADKYDGKRLNSPNDLCYKSNGDLYFTDPPYGLEKNWDDPARELDFCGVYRLSADGNLTLLTKELTRPNGIAFSPDEKTLYVAQSDPSAAIWRAFDVTYDGTLSNSRVLFDATDWVKAGRKGLPDGLKVDKDGNLWATGPGGVVVLDKNGKHLGTINTGEATANCGWGDDGGTLYVTADMHLGRIRTSTKGAGW
jgi:gluconolactonase